MDRHPQSLQLGALPALTVNGQRGGTLGPSRGWDGQGERAPRTPLGGQWEWEGGRDAPVRRTPPAHRPVHAGNGTPSKAAGHVPVHLVTQDVLPAPIAELEELVCVGGHAWGRGHRSVGSSTPPPPEKGALQQGRLWKRYPFSRASQISAVPAAPYSATGLGCCCCKSPVTLKSHWETHRRINSLS